MAHISKSPCESVTNGCGDGNVIAVGNMPLSLLVNDIFWWCPSQNRLLHEKLASEPINSRAKLRLL